MAESTSSSVVDLSPTNEKTTISTPQAKMQTTLRPGEAAIKQQ